MNIHSLKIRFIFICLVLLASVSLLQHFYFNPKMETREIAERLTIQENIVDSLSHTIEETFKDNQIALEKISKLPGIISLNPVEMNRILSEMDEISQFFNYYFVVDTSKTWLSYPSKPHLVGKRISTKDTWIADTFNNNGITFLDAHFAPRINAIVSGYSIPIYTSQVTPKALLRGVLTLSGDNKILNHVINSQIGGTGYIYLTDSKGKLLAHPKIKVSPETFNETDFSMVEPVRLALQGESGVVEFEDNNKKWIASYRQIPTTGWVLIAQQPKEDLLAIAHAEINEFSRFFLFSFIVIIVILALIAHRSLAPLSHLLNNIRSGKPEPKDIYAKDEISLLAHEFEKLYSNLLATNKGLEAEIATRQEIEKDLILAKNEADRANAIKSEFLANMSHEIRTPLNGILGFAKIISGENLPKQQRDYLNMLNDSAERLLHLVNDILDFAKIDAGKMQLENIVFKPRETIFTCLENLRDLALSKNLSYTWSIDENVPDDLWGDPNRLTQVLVNLVSNAIKFTEKGAVKTEVKLKEKSEESSILLFSVRDTGIGVPDEKKETIFKSFTQADLSHSRKFGGSGLGLSISAEFVKMFGGKIWLESNGGSTFFFTARFKHNIAQTMLLKENRDQSKHLYDFPKPLRILLAEDEQINRLLATTILEEKGLHVTTVENGQEAFEAWKAGDFDLILMDIQMPEMDGYQSTTAIRQKEQSGLHIPIIAMTAHALKGDKEKCLQAGMDDYVSKPIAQEELFKSIAKLTR